MDQKLLAFQRTIDDMTAKLQFIFEQEEEFVDGYHGHGDCDQYEQAEGNTIHCQAILPLWKSKFLARANILMEIGDGDF